MNLPDRHLDLGCGTFPRNPYSRGELCGVDIRPLPEKPDFDYRVANLVVAFRVIDARWVYRSDAYSANPGSSENNPPLKGLSRRLRSKQSSS